MGVGPLGEGADPGGRDLPHQLPIPRHRGAGGRRRHRARVGAHHLGQGERNELEGIAATRKGAEPERVGALQGIALADPIGLGIEQLGQAMERLPAEGEVDRRHDLQRSPVRRDRGW